MAGRLPGDRRSISGRAAHSCFDHGGIPAIASTCPYIYVDEDDMQDNEGEQREGGRNMDKQPNLQDPLQILAAIKFVRLDY